MLAAVPSPSFSSLVIQSPHAINFSKPAVLPIQVPLSADPEGFFSTDSASSQVSESRNSALSTVHSSVVNHRRRPNLFMGAMLFIGSTAVHFTVSGKRVSFGKDFFVVCIF